MRVRPVTPAGLVEVVVGRILGAGGADRGASSGGRLAVAVDGPGPAEPGVLADGVVAALRVAGRPALHVPAGGFLRPASLRLERGRVNPDAFYEEWWDVGGLAREVLAPLAPGGDGRVLPSLWDPVTDRATRAGYVVVPPGGVVLVSGVFLLGAGLGFDLAVHLWMSVAAVARRLDPGWEWTVPAYRRYAVEVAPEGFADVVVRCDDPRRPGLVVG